MRHDLERSQVDLDLTLTWPWPEVKVMSYIIRILGSRLSLWYQFHCDILFRSRVIAKNNFVKNEIRWPLVTSGAFVIDLTSNLRPHYRFVYPRAIEWYLETFSSSSRSWVTPWFHTPCFLYYNRLTWVSQWRHNSVTWHDPRSKFCQKVSHSSVNRCAKRQVPHWNLLEMIHEIPRGGVPSDPPGGEGIWTPSGKIVCA